MNNYDVIKKLIGDIEPAGLSDVDKKRYENLKETIHLTHKLLIDIMDVSRCKNNLQASMKKAGIAADNFLKELEDYHS